MRYAKIFLNKVLMLRVFLINRGEESEMNGQWFRLVLRGKDLGSFPR